MAKFKITKTSVDAAEAREKDYFLWDADLAGFGLKVTPAGRKIYVAQYRTGGRKQASRATIGTHGKYTPQVARIEAQRIILEAARGVDHNAEKRVARKAAVELAFDAYADFFTENYLKANWPGSYDRAISTLKCHAIPFFGRTPLTAISKRTISQWLDTLMDRPPTARKAAEVVGKMFKWAEDRGDVERSPMDRTPRPKAGPGRERVIADDELGWVWQAAEALNHPFGSLVQFLSLCGHRRSEAAGMRWDELDFDRLLWEVPKARTKSGRDDVVPLTPEMLAIISSIPRVGPLVFSVSGTNEIGNMSKLKIRLDRKIAISRAEVDLPPLDHWTLHDLRRTAATGMQKLGVSPDMIEIVQGRALKLGAGRRYQRYDYLREKRDALCAWNDHVRSVIGLS